MLYIFILLPKFYAKQTFLIPQSAADFISEHIELQHLFRKTLVKYTFFPVSKQRIRRVGIIPLLFLSRLN